MYMLMRLWTGGGWLVVSTRQNVAAIESCGNRTFCHHCHFATGHTKAVATTAVGPDVPIRSRSMASLLNLPHDSDASQSRGMI